MSLRSGKFKQGQSALCIVDAGQESFCCLGVLAEIESKRDKRIKRIELEYPLFERNNYSFRKPHRKTKTCDSFLPHTWFEGLDKETQNELASMNDKGVSFNDIAKWISKYL